MDEQELLKERFKSAVSSAVKAISEKFDLEIKFGKNIDSKKNSLNLPEVANLKKLQDFTNLRAFADSEALKIKYTDYISSMELVEERDKLEDEVRGILNIPFNPAGGVIKFEHSMGQGVIPESILKRSFIYLV